MYLSDIFVFLCGLATLVSLLAGFAVVLGDIIGSDNGGSLQDPVEPPQTPPIRR